MSILRIIVICLFACLYKSDLKNMHIFHKVKDILSFCFAKFAELCAYFIILYYSIDIVQV